jgi:hypothetical protein
MDSAYVNHAIENILETILYTKAHFYIFNIPGDYTIWKHQYTLVQISFSLIVQLGSHCKWLFWHICLQYAQSALTTHS